MCGIIHKWQLARESVGRFVLALLLVGLAAPSSPALAQETVRVSISDSPPISLRNAQTNAFEGLAVDIIKLITADAGFEPRIEMIAFGAMLAALKDEKSDVIVMSGSEERRRIAQFSTPFARYGEALLVRREDARAYASLDELKDMQVGSNAGGGWIDAATKAGAKIVTFGSAELSLNALQKGEVQAVVGNAPTYRYLMQTGSYSNVRMAASYVPRQLNELAFGVRHTDNRLLDRINGSLTKLGNTGVLNQLRAKWGF